MTAAALAKTEDVILVPIASILPSTVPNYRRRISSKKLDEMAASMRSHGVLEPLVFRPQGDGLELVFGEQRRRAAEIAGLEAVPGIIRGYSDEEVRVARLSENDHRADAHPLDQAEEYADLQRCGYTPQALAEKLGQPVRYVLERLALNDLCSDARVALEKEEISLGVAVLIASLPSHKVQELALKRVTGGHGMGTLTVAEAREEIETQVMLDLSKAEWRLDDGQLVPKAGPCSTCTKRTGNQRELFADASKGDLCTDPICHRGKVDAVWKLRTKTAKVEGINVLSAKDGAAALQSTYYGSVEFQRLDSTVTVGKKNKTVKALLGAEAPLTLARDERTGLAVELVPRKVVEAAIRTAAPEPTGPADKSAAKADAKAKKEREAEKLRAEVRRRTMAGLVSAFEDDALDVGTALSRAVVRAAIHAASNDTRRTVANRRGCPLTVEEGEPTSKRGKGKRQETLLPEQRLDRLVATLELPQLGGLLIELLLEPAAPGKWGEAHDSYVETCVALQVDVGAIEKALRAERAAAAKTKPKAPSKGRKAKPAQPAIEGAS